MSDAALKLLEQIRALPPEEQELLADELAADLPDEGDLAEELDTDPVFRAMLDERLREAEEHPERLQTWEHANAQIDAELARRRAARGQP